MMFRTALVSLILLSAHTAFAQSFEIGAHVASSAWSEFDGQDIGIGGRLTWKPSSMVGVDAGLTWNPSDFPDRIAFTRSRFEGLFGVTVGPRFARVRPFAKAAAGFLDIAPTPGAFACITIFPPPLNCALAGGDTLQAYEIGGGIEFDATRRTFFRVDVADRILKYPGPAFDSNFQVKDEDFAGHAVRFTFGAGLRF